MSLARTLIRSSNKYLACNPMQCLVQMKLNLSSNAESFLCGANANYLEAQYLDWAKSKGSVDSSWDGFYDSLCGPALKIEEIQDDFSPKTVQPKSTSSSSKNEEEIRTKIKLSLAVANLVRAYQARGHLMAKIDPLNLTIPATFLANEKNLTPYVRGLQNRLIAREMESELGEQHMDMVFDLPARTFIGGTETRLPLREIINRLEKVYCSSIGIEYMHMYDMDAVVWLRDKMEKPGAMDIPDVEKKDIMRRLTKGVFLEKYFAAKWPSEKRFGLEGGESMILMMEEIVDTSTKLGVQSIVMAMQHRGRLNMLVNVCRKQLADVFAQFKPLEPKESVSGDVKYHLGTNIHRFIRRTNRYIKVTMSANPSHLEVVSPVVVGKTKAEQYWKGDSNGDKVMAIVLHGDAAICGQGVVFETIGCSALPNFTTHGVVHIICNNQIGYTTEPRFHRSSPYCSDVAKCIDAPVLHVNADDPEAVAYVGRVAIEFRCKFKKDVVIDLVCYRRYGHSEEDEPMYTQPFMYKKIRTLRTIDVMYSDKLKAQGIATDEDIKKWEKEYTDTLNLHFDMSKKITKLSIMEWVDTPWTGFFESVDPNTIKETGISQQTVTTITNHFVKPPEPWAFDMHPGVTKILKNREKLVFVD